MRKEKHTTTARRSRPRFHHAALPGPLASLMLSEAGAEVIKIEKPRGEDARRFPPNFGGESAAFALLNRGKKSLVLDQKNEADPAKLIPLIERAAVPRRTESKTSV